MIIGDDGGVAGQHGELGGGEAGGRRRGKKLHIWR